MPSLIPLGRYRVEYADGTSEETRSNFGGIMELEREYPDEKAPPGTTLAYGVWCYLGKPGGDIGEWAGKVVEITPIEPEPADPTPPAPTAG